MPYITSTDISLHVQDVNLQQIINATPTILDEALELATAEAKSYLVQKYDVTAELAKTGADRDQQMVAYVIDIALYHLHMRIAPKNIPELRTIRYMGKAEDRGILNGSVVYPSYCALGWLQACAFGDITPKLAKIEPLQGTRIRYGGNPKKQNSY